MRWHGKVSASVDVVLACPKIEFRAAVVYIVHLRALPHFQNHVVGYAFGTTMFAVIPRLLSRPQVIKSLNRNLAAIDF